MSDAYGQPIIDPNDFAPERTKLVYNPLPSREQVKKAAKLNDKKGGGKPNPITAALAAASKKDQSGGKLGATLEV